MKVALVSNCLALVGAIALVGCVDREGEKVDPAFVARNTLTVAPTPKLVVNGDLGGKVVYLGADVDKDTISPGDEVKITHYWKVVEAPGPEWRVFTHVNGGPKDWMNVDQTDLRKQHGPDRWKTGEIYKDEQTFRLRKEWSSSTATVFVGLYRKGGQTDKDRLAVVAGPTDGKGRLEVAKLKVNRSAAAATPTGAAPFVIKRASGPITIDGKADDAAWAQAASTGPFKDAEGGAKVGAETSARLLWDDEFLYAFVEVSDPDVASQFTKDDEPIWKEDCVELFIDADQNGRGYVELQVSPLNTKFDSWFQIGRPNGDVAWNAGMQTAVTVDGTVNQRGDTDRGWKAEIAIPLAAVKGRDAAMAVKTPPAVGDRWKLNLVRVEKPADKGLTAAAWAQITIQDFHAIDRLMTVVFADASGQVAAPTPSASAPVPMAPGATPAVPGAPGAPGAPATVPGAPGAPPPGVIGRRPGTMSAETAGKVVIPPLPPKAPAPVPTPAPAPR